MYATAFAAVDLSEFNKKMHHSLPIRLGYEAHGSIIQ
jgi:hypothetical protein